MVPESLPCLPAGCLFVNRLSVLATCDVSSLKSCSDTADYPSLASTGFDNCLLSSFKLSYSARDHVTEVDEFKVARQDLVLLAGHTRSVEFHCYLYLVYWSGFTPEYLPGMECSN